MFGGGRESCEIICKGKKVKKVFGIYFMTVLTHAAPQKHFGNSLRFCEGKLSKNGLNSPAWYNYRLFPWQVHKPRAGIHSEM